MPIHSESLLESLPIPPAEVATKNSISELKYAEIEFGERLAMNVHSEITLGRISKLTTPIIVKRNAEGRTTPPEEATRIFEEGERATKVADNPNIVTVYDYGEKPKGWIAMEYLKGGTLTDRRDEMGLGQRLWTAYALLEAVTHANEMGLTHRDITPSNILFQSTPDNYWPIPKVIDWGEARENYNDELPENVTSAYAAPEFQRGTLPNRQLNRADVYQASVVIYELLTGKMPEGYGDTVVPPSRLAELPTQLDEPLMDGLEFDPTDRPSARSMKKAFSKILKDCLSEISSQDTSNAKISAEPNEKPNQDEIQTAYSGDSGTEEPKQKRIELNGAWPTYRGSETRSGCRSPHRGDIQGIQREWLFSTDAEVRSSVAISNEVAVFGSTDGNVYAVDRTTGDRLWKHESETAFHASPAVTDKSVYIGGRDKKLHSLALESGDQKWSQSADMWVDSSPLVYDGMVYVGSNDFRVYAFDAEDGSFIWKEDTGGEIGKSSPAIAEDVLYIAGDSGSLYAIDAHTGIEKWSFDTRYSIPTTPALSENRAYFGSSQSRLYAIDTTDRSSDWVYQTGGKVESSPAIWRDTIVFGCNDGSIYAVDKTGSERWSQNLGQSILSDPVIIDTTVFVGCCDNNLYAIDVETGQPIDRYDTGGWVRTSPAYADGRLYVGSETGVHCLKFIQ